MNAVLPEGVFRSARSGVRADLKLPSEVGSGPSRIHGIAHSFALRDLWRYFPHLCGMSGDAPFLFVGCWGVAHVHLDCVYGARRRIRGQAAHMRPDWVYAARLLIFG